jgi:hypothetical protein
MGRNKKENMGGLENGASGQSNRSRSPACPRRQLDAGHPRAQHRRQIRLPDEVVAQRVDELDKNDLGDPESVSVWSIVVAQVANAMSMEDIYIVQRLCYRLPGASNIRSASCTMPSIS